MQHGCQFSQDKMQQCEKGIVENWRVVNGILEMCLLGSPEKWRVNVPTHAWDQVLIHAHIGSVAGHTRVSQTA
ncbi:hypothetical protein PR048_001493 [Dryococelus australis]|uniref:Uncharacterized protein n=1 Tax=Dryococelus australis TaxID=614101 RepID=A0ABQ9IHI3_9NEOP|nr:hypothetical protein PR048_001493 [Dryococelus australis]